MVIKVDETDVALSVKYKKSAIFKASEIFLPIVLCLMAIIIAAYLILGINLLLLLLDMLMISVPVFVYFRLAFTNSKPVNTLSQWQEKQDMNLALTMNVGAVETMLAAERLAKNKNMQLLPAWLIGGMLEVAEGREILLRLGLFLRPQDVEGLLSFSGTDPASLDRVLGEAINYSISNGEQFLQIEDLMVGLAKVDAGFQKVMSAVDADELAVLEVANWHKRLRREKISFPFWEKPVIGGVGQDWAYGYTPALQQFAMNLTTVAQYSGAHIEVFSRSSYVETMEQLLSKSSKNNVLLVGDYGVGKKTLVMALAQKITSGSIHPALRYKQIMQVNVGALLSGAHNPGEIVARVEVLMSEAARAGNIILFFDDFHAMVSSDQTAGSVNVAEIILPYLQGSALQLIGSTNIDKYHRDIEVATGIVAAFEKIDIPEPSSDEALKMLEESIGVIEGKYQVIFLYQALHEIVKLSERYMHDKPFPQKAIDLASEVAVKVSASKNSVVSPKDVESVVTVRTHVPVGNVESDEKTKLLNLENILHQRVVGQGEAVDAVANALRRSRSGLSDKHRPIGNFLFIGPTGVGKTEMAKALAEAYFGDEKRMIRFDMSEYQDEASIYRLIGAPPGPGSEGTAGLLTAAVHDNPFSLVLLDELEKAHPNLLTLFLQVFDDGRLTGGNGKTIDFTNTIIIATSNAGSEVVREYLASGKNDVNELKEKLLGFLQEQGIYRPEFLNRFDSVIAFRPLTQDEIRQVAGLMIAGLNKQLAEKGMSITVEKDGLDYLVKEGYDPVFGARPMRRTIQEKVENVLAKKMLIENLGRGTVINLTLADLSGQPVAVGHDNSSEPSQPSP